MTHDNDTNETFIRTAPPLNRFTVKLGGGPAPWKILTAYHARGLAYFFDRDGAPETARIMREYADAVDAMTPGYPERDTVAAVEDLGF